MLIRRLSWGIVGLVVATAPAIAAFTSDPAFTADVQRGRKLTDEAAKKLEAMLTLHPDDASARAKLIGYYADRAAAFPQRRLGHVLWLIRHRPADPLTPAYGVVSPLSDAPGYAAASTAWDEQTTARPTDTAVLADAAAFFDNGTDTAKAQDLLNRAMVAEPKSPDWPARLALSLERQADRQPAQVVTLCGQALALRQLAYKLAEGRVERFHILIPEPADAYRMGDHIAAKRLAGRLLETADDFPNDPARSDAVHTANVVLGKVALHTGNGDRAAANLAAAAKVVPSPGLAAAGPDLSLAAELLAKGDRSAVREYLVACQQVWPGGRERLKGWVAALDAGGTPELK